MPMLQRTSAPLPYHCSLDHPPHHLSPPPPPIPPPPADKTLRYGYEDVEVVHRVYGSACYITSSLPRWVAGWVGGWGVGGWVDR